MFYAYHGESAKREDAEAWLHSQGRGTRAEYKAARFAAYEALDAFFRGRCRTPRPADLGPLEDRSSSQA